MRASECLDSPINVSTTLPTYFVDLEPPSPVATLAVKEMDSNDLLEDDKASEKKKTDDGWSDYQVISILGEGSYGRVYKVVRKEAP